MNRNPVEISRFWHLVGSLRMSWPALVKFLCSEFFENMFKYWVRMGWPALRVGASALMKLCVDLNFLKLAKCWVRMDWPALSLNADALASDFFRKAECGWLTRTADECVRTEKFFCVNCIFRNLSKSQVRMTRPAVRMGASALRILMVYLHNSFALSLSHFIPLPF